jgi:Protein of unknown function (DUF3011)
MFAKLVKPATCAALVIAQMVTPLMAQSVSPARPLPPTDPQVQPARPRPVILPPRPAPQPVVRPLPPTRPVPGPGEPGGPQIQPPVYPVNPPIGAGARFAGTVRCESLRSFYRRCPAVTSNRTRVARVYGGTCVRGRTWGSTASYVWVDKGCRGDFYYGYADTQGGNGLYPAPQPLPEPEKSKGPSTGAIIAGVAVAGGLIAILASASKKKKNAAEPTTAPEPQQSIPTASFPAGPPALIAADLSPLPVKSRASVQNCMFDAARQIGVTGGTRLRYDRLISLEPGNGGWRIRSAMTAAYPDGERTLEMFCRATPAKIIQLDFS